MTIIETLSARARDDRLKRLLSYLSADPANERLLHDAADQALSAHESEIAADLLRSLSRDLTVTEVNLLGLANMQLRNFSEAARLFRTAIDKGAEGASLRFNLAWSLAMTRRHSEALDLLSAEVTEDLAQAAMLEVQILHEQGKFDEAAEAARRHIETHPHDQGLAAAVSVLALDIEDLDLARSCAERAGGHPDALTTLATLALSVQQVDEADRLFEMALLHNQQAPRAWIGRGLVRLLQRDGGAAEDIERGASLFADHIGSWIAAGWAYLIAGQPELARKRFERALAIDPNFAETHGSLAVVEALQGRAEQAQKLISVALRLDRECFSASFAETLLSERSGDSVSAGEMLDRLLNSPVNVRGDTAAAALVRLGLH